MRVFHNAGLYLQENEFDLVFDDMDPDGSGVVEIGEFLQWLRSGSETAVKLRKKMSVDEFIHTAIRELLKRQSLRNNDIVVVLAGNFSRGTGFSFIEVGTIDYLRERAGVTDEDLLA